MENPKYKIGEKVYLVERSNVRDEATVIEFTVKAVKQIGGIILYDLGFNEKFVEEKWVYDYNSAIEIMLNYKVSRDSRGVIDNRI